MKKNILGIFSFLLLSVSSIAQNELSVYATMDASDAASFKVLFPEDIEILHSNEAGAAVLLSEVATHKIHDNVRTHGPGYIFYPSREKAVASLNKVAQRNTQINFSITEDAFVNECLDLVHGPNIENDILELQGYGTRFHTKPQARQSVLDLQAKWDAMIAAAGRTDIHTRIYEHVDTPMPSVILTIDGADTPDEFVIVGGHIDSTSWIRDEAPGADDNASGIASLNEMLRVLLAQEFVPSRTIEIMAYAAEEIGLVGSNEIAGEYASNGVNVHAYVQFDMTGYKGSASDIYITTDSYNSADLNGFLTELMDHYNSDNSNPDHNFTYSYTQCGYGCSDHASWAQHGYDAAFPFEASMNDSNPHIHTPNDVYSFFNTPNHSMKFTKLGLEFLIETAKPRILSVTDFSEAAVSVSVKEKILKFQLGNRFSTVKQIAIYNLAGQKVRAEDLNQGEQHVDLSQFSDGFYFVQFVLENNHTVTKKFVLN